MNDVFDIFNSRRSATSITKSNWDKRKDILETFLFILDETERIHSEGGFDAPATMFMSQTTLQGWRLSSLSLIALTEEMLDDSIDETVYDEPFQQVLSAKFNQDPVEVC